MVRRKIIKQFAEKERVKLHVGVSLFFACIASETGCREYELRKVITESEDKTGHSYLMPLFLQKNC
jgi:hypothetical protein